MKLSNLSGVSCSGASNRRVISVSRTILSLLFAMAATAVAQSSVTITNPAALLGWDAAIYASTYDATITTNQTRITTNGYNPPSTAIIDFQSGNQTVHFLPRLGWLADSLSKALRFGPVETMHVVVEASAKLLLPPSCASFILKLCELVRLTQCQRSPKVILHARTDNAAASATADDMNHFLACSHFDNL